MLKPSFVVFVKGSFKIFNWKEISLVFWQYFPYRKQLVMQLQYPTFKITGGCSLLFSWSSLMRGEPLWRLCRWGSLCWEMFVFFWITSRSVICPVLCGTRSESQKHNGGCIFAPEAVEMLRNLIQWNSNSDSGRLLPSCCVQDIPNFWQQLSTMPLRETQ